MGRKGNDINGVGLEDRLNSVRSFLSELTNGREILARLTHREELRKSRATKLRQTPIVLVEDICKVTVLEGLLNLSRGIDGMVAMVPLLPVQSISSAERGYGMGLACGVMPRTRARVVGFDGPR